jgi:hypothetical protein
VADDRNLLGAVRWSEKPLVWACAALLAAALSLGACGAGAGATVAEVDGIAITKKAFDHWMSVVAAADRGTAVGRAALERQALKRALSAEWTRAEARALGIAVSDREAGHQLELFKYEQIEGLQHELSVRDAEVRKVLLSSRVAHQDRLQAMKLAVLEARIEQERISRAGREVTPIQIAAYYREHQSLFAVPERRDYNIVETFKKSAIEQAKREIDSGESFKSVAHKLTIDPVAHDGIRLNVPRGDQSNPLEREIFSAKPGVLVGPRQVAAYYLFKVLRIYPAHEQRLAPAQASIRRRLVERLASTTLVPELARRWATRTRCATGNLAASCRLVRSQLAGTHS